MRSIQWLLPLFFALSVGTAMADDASEKGKLETINGTPAVPEQKMKDCPMHQGKKECPHKNSEPCPYHKEEKYHGKVHDKCEHKQRS